MDASSNLAHFFENLFEFSHGKLILSPELINNHFPTEVNRLADFDVPEDAIADQSGTEMVSRLHRIVTVLAKNMSEGVSVGHEGIFLPVGVDTAQDDIVTCGVFF